MPIPPSLLSLLYHGVSCAGHINVPGIYADVAPLLPEEAALYSAVDFDLDEFRRGVGVSGKLLHETKEELLQHRWRNPTLSLHGIEGAFSGSGEKTVLPGACLHLCVLTLLMIAPVHRG